MTRARFLRPMRAALAASLITAGGVALLPAAGAHASAQSFSLSVTGGYNGTSALGTASGTLTADLGGTTMQYSFQVCGQSTYPNTRITITAGTGSTTQYVGAGSCQSFSGTVTSSTGLSTASIVLTGGTFYPGNTYQTYSKSQSVSFGTIVQPIPQPVTAPFTASVTGGYNNTQALGTASGSITGTRYQTTATYSVSLCGQSTYPNARVTITAGSASVTHYVNYSNCGSFSGTLTSTYGITSAVVTVYGSTFYPGNTYTPYSKSRSIAF